MAAKLLDGTALLETTKAQLATRVASLGERGITPGLGTILVGSDPNSHAYVRGKRAACEEIGMVSRHTELPESVSPEDLHATIADYNSDPAVDAFIVQLPLPGHLDEEAALLAIEPDKDADG